MVLAGPGVVFLQVVAFALVVGALFTIVHALTRHIDRWRFSWTRWIWVVLAVEYVISLVVMFLVKNEIAATVFGISFVIAIVVELSYLLRVVFPPYARPVAARNGRTISEADATPEEPLDADL